MRILSTLMASFIFLLMLAPLLATLSEREMDCCAKRECADERSLPGDPVPGDGTCNPFLCQNCCAKFTNCFIIPFEKEYSRPFWLVPGSEQIRSLFSADFWQPPKLA